MNTSQPDSARFAQSYVFTVNDAFVFIFSVGGQEYGLGCGRPVAPLRARPGPVRQWDNEMQLDSAGPDGT